MVIYIHVYVGYIIDIDINNLNVGQQVLHKSRFSIFFLIFMNMIMFRI